MSKIVVQKNGSQKVSDKKRADLFLVDKFKLTRNQAQKKIKAGLVFVNGKLVNSKTLIGSSDLIVIKEKEKTNSKIKINTIFEDQFLLVVDKPAGLSSHPAPGEEEATISELFSEKLYSNDDERWPGVVHRLDKGTSGIMILAKTPEIKKELQGQFKKRKVTKTYLALVEGRIKPREGIINLPLKRETTSRERFGINENGKAAKSKYVVQKDFEGYSLLRLIPETGRTHQLRVHLSAIGYPIVGDTRYGKQSSLVSRIFLHAEKITFIHPDTKKKLFLEAPLPKELKTVLQKLELIEETAKN